MNGIDLLRDPRANKGTAFTLEERERFDLTGLLPPRVESIEEQVERVLAAVQSKSTAIEKYVCLATLHNDNETLFFRVLIDNLEALLPIVYTPTVGQACLEWSRIYQRPRGLHITARDRGRIREVLRHWPSKRVRVIVVSDGGRILGLGDLGANGMGIPIGKLILYVACAGVAPSSCLPVMLDVGTGTDSVRDDPLYLGLREPRLAGPAYAELLEELVTAAQEVFPGVLIQFEDFANVNAFALLARYRNRACCVNDDIQGTGAMALAGLYAASRLTGKPLREQRLLFLGAGEANIGIASLVVSALTRAGLSQEQARRRCWLIDSQGLVVSRRTDLAEHKRPFAHDHAAVPDLVAAVQAIRPTALIGASGKAGAFTQPALAAMARINDRPVIFALSNPTPQAECTAEQAYRATQGRAIFAAGSPFAPVTVEGRSVVTGQANNSYVFPGVGLGVLASGATRVTDDMFLAAAQALADQVGDQDLAVGRVFPAPDRMRRVAAAVAAAVAQIAYRDGLATHVRPPDLGAEIRTRMYHPSYAGSSGGAAD